MQQTAVHFYLGYQKQPWFGPAGSENTYALKLSFSVYLETLTDRYKNINILFQLAISSQGTFLVKFSLISH